MKKNESKDKKLIKEFFKENLSKKEKEEFLKRASSDKEFLKEFVDELESEVDSRESIDEEKKNNEEPV